MLADQNSSVEEFKLEVIKSLRQIEWTQENRTVSLYYSTHSSSLSTCLKVDITYDAT